VPETLVRRLHAKVVMNTRKTFSILGMTLVHLAVASVSSGQKVKDEEVTSVELAIRSAENAAATQHAKPMLDRARASLSIAQSERAKGRHPAARRALEEATAAARAAESQAKAVDVELRAAAVKKEADALEQRTRELNQQIR
jgi:hypothetical protein